MHFRGFFWDGAAKGKGKGKKKKKQKIKTKGKNRSHEENRRNRRRKIEEIEGEIRKKYFFHLLHRLAFLLRKLNYVDL